MSVGTKRSSKHDIALKKASPAVIRNLYQLMYDIHQILRNSNIPYWIIGGTLLGAVRHGGIIPWDDDLDIGIMNSNSKKLVSLKSLLAKCGYSIVKVWFGYKIFYTRMKKVPGEIYAFPNLDIFVYKRDGDKYIQALKQARDTWPKEWYPCKTIDSLKKYRFGDMVVTGPSDHQKYFDRMYGKDWNEIAYRQYDHSKEETVESIRVKLRKRDRVPAGPTGPLVDRPCINSSMCLRPTRIVNPDRYITKATRVIKRVDNCDGNFDADVGTYVINCDAHTVRMAKFERYASEAGLKYCRESCVKGKEFTYNLFCEMMKKKLLTPRADMNPIEIAINLSHYNVWQRILNNGYDYGLVLEDDAEVNPNFVDKVNSVLNGLESKGIEFDILFLWNGNWMGTRKYLKHVAEISGLEILQETHEYNAGAVAYIISKKFAQFMLKKAYPIRYPQDILLGEFARRGIHLTLKMKYARSAKCWESPILGNECEGEGGTGATTQEYSLPTVKRITCNACP